MAYKSDWNQLRLVQDTGTYLSFHFLWSAVTAKSTIRQVLYLLFFTLLRGFKPALANGLSIDFKRKRVSSSLEDSSQNTSRSYSRCSLYRVNFSSYYQVLQSLNQSFGDCSKCSNYNWYHRHFNFPSLCFVLKQGIGISFFRFQLILFCGLPVRQSSLFGCLSFYLFFSSFCWQGLVVWLRLDDPFVSQNPWEFCSSNSPILIPGWAYIACSHG